MDDPEKIPTQISSLWLEYEIFCINPNYFFIDLKGKNGKTKYNKTGWFAIAEIKSKKTKEKFVLRLEWANRFKFECVDVDRFVDNGKSDKEFKKQQHQFNRESPHRIPIEIIHKQALIFCGCIKEKMRGFKIENTDEFIKGAILSASRPPKGGRV
ncbi:MAG: hypothetical protein V1777_04350 [Candidatus Micrarchaeota archaeon]